MKRFLPLIILILAPLSLLLAKPAYAYVAQPGDSLWTLAENRVSNGDIMVINAVKNIEIMLNNLDDTNYYLEVGQDYTLLTQTQISFLVGQISQSMPGNSAYLIANPAPVPNWQELRQTATSLSPTIILSSQTSPVGFPVSETTPSSLPQIQGAHTSIIPLADSPFPY